MVRSTGKLVRQSTFAPQESDILRAIDERFEELEETKILAALVPQLHQRLHTLEQKLKLRSEAGPQWGDETSPQKIDLREPSEGESEIKNEVKVEEVEMKMDLPITKQPTKITELSRAKVKQMDEKVLDTQTTEYYTFGESTWDLVIFIGTGALGPLGSFQTCLLAVVNVLMQIVFVAIAYYNFTLPDIDENSVRDTLRWRRSSGHSFSDYSDVAKESLVHRVCKLDKSLESSGIQVALMENINKYLKSDATGLEGFFTGQILCIVALICWYLMVAKEVSHALALHRGIMAMRKGPTTLDTRENPFTQVTHYRLRTVATRRKIFSGFLLLYRLLAAGLLVFVGTFFLVYTVSVTELILNAVALGIILDIDDLLFDALATTPGRHLVHQLDPLHMPPFPRIRGADAKSMFMSISIPSITLLVYYTMLEPMVMTLESVKGAMCGGNQNFVWALDKRRIAHLSPTFGGGWEEEEESIKSTAIQEGEDIGFGLSVNSTRFGVWVTDVSVLSDMTAADLDDLIENSNSQCEDLGNGLPLQSYLRYFLQNESIQSCDDVKPYCDSITKMPEFAVDGGVGFSARLLCSATCGCREPGGSHISVQGCPYKDVCKTTEDFTTVLAGTTCVEQDAATLRNSSAWRSWLRTIRDYASSDGVKGTREAAILADAMEEHGCGFLLNLSAQNISLGGCFSWGNNFDWEFKTLEFFCPIACGCSWHTPRNTGCPRPFGLTCDSLDHCITVDDQHYCPGENAEIVKNLVLYAYHDAAMLQYASQVDTAFSMAFGEVAGLDPALVVYQYFSWPGTAFVDVFLIDGQNRTAMQGLINGKALEEMQAQLDSQLVALGVPLNELGLNITFCCDARGPVGGYGYGYGGRRLSHSS